MPQLILRGKRIGIVDAILFDKDGTLTRSENRLLELAKLRVTLALRIYKERRIKQINLKELHQLLMLTYGIHNNQVNPNSSLAIASRKDNIISTATVLSILGETWPESIKLSYEIFESADSLLKNKTNFSKKDER